MKVGGSNGAEREQSGKALECRRNCSVEIFCTLTTSTKLLCLEPVGAVPRCGR